MLIEHTLVRSHARRSLIEGGETRTHSSVLQPIHDGSDAIRGSDWGAGEALGTEASCSGFFWCPSLVDSPDGTNASKAAFNDQRSWSHSGGNDDDDDNNNNNN